MSQSPQLRLKISRPHGAKIFVEKCTGCHRERQQQGTEATHLTPREPTKKVLIPKKSHHQFCFDVAMPGTDGQLRRRKEYRERMRRARNPKQEIIRARLCTCVRSITTRGRTHARTSTYTPAARTPACMCLRHGQAIRSETLAPAIMSKHENR